MCKPKPGKRCAHDTMKARDAITRRLAAASQAGDLDGLRDVSRDLLRNHLDYWATPTGRKALATEPMVTDQTRQVRQQAGELLTTMRRQAVAMHQYGTAEPKQTQDAVAEACEEELYLHAERWYETHQPDGPNPAFMADIDQRLTAATAHREQVAQAYPQHLLTQFPASRCDGCGQWADDTHECGADAEVEEQPWADLPDEGPHNWAKGTGGETDLSYRMQHRAPYDDSADGDEAYYRQAHDLTAIFPDDVYDHPERYGTVDDETVQQLRAARNNPDAMVTIYRAVPKGVTTINKGDWITLSRQYAEEHSYGLEDRTDDSGASDGQVLSYQVPASQVWADSNDLAEFGYDGPSHIDTAADTSGGEATASSSPQLPAWDRTVQHDPVTAGDLAAHLEAKHGAALYVRGGRDGAPVVLSEIQVPKDKRGQGIGQAVMDDFLTEADRNGWTVALSPDNAFGSSKTRLTAWYKSLGFVPNKGRNKDYRVMETMIRPPQQ